MEPLEPPAALLRVPERPKVPVEPTTNADAAEYLLRLYEHAIGLERQIAGIGAWVVEARKIRSGSP